MSHGHPALVVAGWEFRRYFKWKDQILGLAIFLLLGLALVIVARVISGDAGPSTVALSGISLEAPEDSGLRFVPAPANEAERAELLASGEIDGLVSRRPDGGFDLLVAKEPRFRAELEDLLGQVVRRERLAASGLTEDELTRLLAPAELAVSFTDPERARRGRGEKIAAGVFIALMLMTVFTSMAYLLTGITGEKQLRVTESVIAAIPPQAWIDGKILGITAYSLASIGNLVAGSLFVALGARLATDFRLPEAAVRPEVLAGVIVFTTLGMLLWNTAFAALAATIDDPNTSTRTSLIMLPVVPAVLALAVFRAPEGLIARFLAIFPLTSAPAMPVRIVLADPGLVEQAIAAALLVAAIWALRRLAGRIFEIGMLLYGKEPTFREIARWARAR